MKKFDKILSMLYAIGGTFALVCYGSYFIKLLMFPEGVLPMVSALIVISGVTLPFIFRKPLRRFLGRAYIVLKSLICAALLFYAVSFSLMCAMIYLPSADEIPPESLPSDTVIVTFGAKIKEDRTPGSPLARRLEKTAELMKACPGAICIVTGGKGDDEPCSEALVMRDYLVSLGISEDRIIMEDQAKNTLENIEYTAELMEREVLSGRPVACVSTDFHIPRIRYLAKERDFADYYYRCYGNTPFNDFGSLVREYMSYGKLILLGHL